MRGPDAWTRACKPKATQQATAPTKSQAPGPAVPTPSDEGSSDAADVRAVAYAFFRPAKAGEGGRSCVQLTASEHRRLDRAGGCAKVLNRFGRRFLTGQEVVVEDIRVDRAAGTATASVIPSAVAGPPP